MATLAGPFCVCTNDTKVHLTPGILTVDCQKLKLHLCLLRANYRRLKISANFEIALQLCRCANLSQTSVPTKIPEQITPSITAITPEAWVQLQIKWNIIHKRQLNKNLLLPPHQTDFKWSHLDSKLQEHWTLFNRCGSWKVKEAMEIRRASCCWPNQRDRVTHF